MRGRSDAPTRRPRYAVIGSRGYPSTYGGFETLVRRLAPFLTDQGAEVTVYGRGGPLRWDSRTVDGVRVRHTPGIDGMRSSTLSYGLTACLDAAWRRHDAALVLNVANGFWLPLLRAAGVPTVVNVDGIEWERDKWSPLGKRVFERGARATARWADEIVVDSRAIGDYWAAHFGVPSRFIPYGGEIVDDDGSDRVADVGLTPGDYLLVVARLVPENNVDLFLDAVELLGGRYPVVVVGSAVSESPLERRLADLQATQPHVRWLGHVSDQVLLTQLWRHSGLYVHGHSVGGTNPALLQALGAGSSTIALDTVYNREVLGPGWPTFPAGEPERLAELIDELMLDEAARRAFSERGRQTIAGRYRWADVLQAYADALAAAACPRPARPDRNGHGRG